MNKNGYNLDKWRPNPYKKDKEYKYFGQKGLNWEEARKVCKNQKDSDLISLRNKTEYGFFKEYLIYHLPSHEIQDIWVGLKRSEKSEFEKWVDGTPFVTTGVTWLGGEPSKTYEGVPESCGQLKLRNGDYDLKDNLCDDVGGKYTIANDGFICERNKS